MRDFILICCGVAIGLIIAWTIYIIYRHNQEKIVKKIIEGKNNKKKVYVEDFKPKYDKIDVYEMALAKEKEKEVAITQYNIHSFEQLVSKFPKYCIISCKDDNESKITRLIITKEKENE